MRRDIIVSFLIIAGLILIAVGSTLVLAQPCGPLRHWHAQRIYQETEHHMEAVERSLNNHIAAPSYLLAQLNSDLRVLQYQNTPRCFATAEASLECALQNEIAYADHWSQESGNPVPEAARKQYQACLTDYYTAIEDLKIQVSFP